jgi:hypothetical protein
MNPKMKLGILWAGVILFLALFIYWLAWGDISQQFYTGMLFGIVIMSVAKRLEQYRLKLVNAIKRPRKRKQLAANPADYGLTWSDIVQGAAKGRKERDGR